jgi:hypothetical protein
MSLNEWIEFYVARFFENERFIKNVIAGVAGHGVKPDLQKLLKATRKKDAKRYADNLTLTNQDLASLTLNAASLGFTHRAFFKEFIPQNIGPITWPAGKIVGGVPQDQEAGKKFFKQVTATFAARQRIHVHLFENETEHHFFFFDAHDAYGVAGNHWIGGNHVHYSSHLWGIPKEGTFQGFETRGERPTNVHIKYKDIAETI